MENDKAQVEVDKVDETVSYRGGFSFHFEDAGHNIDIRCSAVTGKESVYYDDKLVEEKRSFRRKSSIEFLQGDDRYEVELNVVDMFKGETHCTLIKNDLHIKTIRKALIKTNQISGKSGWLKVSLIFAFGLISGYLLMDLLLMVFGG